MSGTLCSSMTTGFVRGMFALHVAAAGLLGACSGDEASGPGPTHDAAAGGDEAGTASGGAAGRAGSGGARAGGAAGSSGSVHDSGHIRDGGPPPDAAGGRSTAAEAGTVDGGTDAKLAPLTEATFPAAFAAAYCPTIAGCCAHGTDGCEADVTAQVSGVLDKGKTAGNIFDAARAAECVATVASLGATVRCASDFASTVAALGACTATLDGTVAPGGACTEVTDCRHGLMQGNERSGFVGCSQYGGTTTPRCRAFVPTDQAGAACEEGFGGSAATVAVCAGEHFCAAGTCQLLPGKGEACTSQCAAGLACASSKCASRTPLGGNCTTVPCVTGASCDSTSKCVADPEVPWIADFGFWSTSYMCPG